MCGHTSNSTSLPEPSGPTDDRFVYQLTAAGKKALEAYEEATGLPAHVGVVPVAAVAAAIEEEERRRHRRDRAEKARENGQRLGTVSVRWQGTAKVPHLRISGDWLRQAGFEVGRQYEVAVTAGRLTIQLV